LPPVSTERMMKAIVGGDVMGRENRPDGRSTENAPRKRRGIRGGTGGLGKTDADPSSKAWVVVRRVGVSFVGLVAAWAIGFFGPGLWESAKIVAGQDALGVAILRDYQIPTDPTFHFDDVIVPGPLSEFPLPAIDNSDPLEDEPTTVQAWKYSRNEVDAMTTAVRLVFTGIRAESVIIQKLSVRVIARRVPVRGVFALDSTGGQGSPMEIRYLRANLDSGMLQWRTGEDKPTSPVALALDRGDQVIVDLIAATAKCDCDWVVDVTYTVGSESTTMTLPDKGHFRTSALSRAAVWDMAGEPRSTCDDYKELKPTLCNHLPANFDGGRLKVRLHSHSGKYATGYGLAVE
jgi:hypothetical protein